MARDSGFLRAAGSKITDGEGREVRLRGFSLAGWLNFENFIIGIPGHESGIRAAVRRVLGEGRSRFFFDSFLKNFVSEDDFRFLEGMGCNCARVPFNYRHFESDDAPFEYREEGFAWLDAAVRWARAHGIYLILDMHAAQGSQNRGFFTDNISGMAFLWDQRMYQDRAIALWREIARRYAAEPAIAGYDILNEPIPADISQLNSFYHRAAEAIREVDPRHILFIEGDRYSSSFEGLDHPFDPNVVYSAHWYSCCGMEVMEYPGEFEGRRYDRERLQQEYAERTAFMRERGVPHWLGETSVTFPPSVTEASRMRFLEDVLSVVEDRGDSWTFGIYKDLGKTGIVYADPDSAWVRRIAPVHDAVTELRCNPFAGNLGPGEIDRLCERIGARVGEVVGDLDTGRSAQEMAGEVRFYLSECLFPRWLQMPFARLFAGMEEPEIAAMMESWAFVNCRVRRGWADVVGRTIARHGRA